MMKCKYCNGTGVSHGVFCAHCNKTGVAPEHEQTTTDDNVAGWPATADVLSDIDGEQLKALVGEDIQSIFPLRVNATIERKPNPLWLHAQIKISDTEIHINPNPDVIYLCTNASDYLNASEARALAAALNGMADALDALEMDGE